MKSSRSAVPRGPAARARRGGRPAGRRGAGSSGAGLGLNRQASGAAARCRSASGVGAARRRGSHAGVRCQLRESARDYLGGGRLGEFLSSGRSAGSGAASESAGARPAPTRRDAPTPVFAARCCHLLLLVPETTIPEVLGGRHIEGGLGVKGVRCERWLPVRWCPTRIKLAISPFVPPALIMLSVRLGRSSAICFHRFPRVAWACSTILSSEGDSGEKSRATSSWFDHRILQLLPLRSVFHTLRAFAICEKRRDTSDHEDTPICPTTSRRMSSSSCGRA